MLQIHCPYCQEVRDEEDFTYVGEAHIQRPLGPDSLSDAQWGDYLYFRKNPRGLHHELWRHTAGCGRYFNATRNTLTYEIPETYPMGAQPSVTEPTKDGGER